MGEDTETTDLRMEVEEVDEEGVDGKGERTRREETNLYVK